MDSLFLDTPSGQWISARHIVVLDILDTGVEEQMRHTVQATLVTGDRQALRIFQGSDSGTQAEQFLSDLFDRLGAQRFVSGR